MSRFDGWLVRYIVMKGTPVSLPLNKAARGACTRPETFAKALRDPELLRADATYMGIDADEMRDIRRWIWQLEAEREIEESMVASAASRTAPKPASERYRGNGTRLGVTCPAPRSQRDALNIPINPIEHPDPQGEWHDGLNAAGRR